MREILAFLLLVGAGAAEAQTIWTNTAGHAFTARLEGLTDTRATFVMGDGATNVLALSALDAASQATARQVRQLPEIPAVLRATFALCARDLKRSYNLYLDRRLDEADYASTQRKILAGFHAMYVKHGLPSTAYAPLEHRLLNSVKTAASP